MTGDELPNRPTYSHCQSTLELVIRDYLYCRKVLRRDTDAEDDNFVRDLLHGSQWTPPKSDTGNSTYDTRRYTLRLSC